MKQKSQEDPNNIIGEPAFGLWKESDIDGLEYQLKLRAEFDRSDEDREWLDAKPVGKEIG